MAYLSESIITNVGSDYIEQYLNKNGLKRAEEVKGQDLVYWANDLLQNQRINIEKFEDFLFEELFWGKRKSIHIYKLDSPNKNKYKGDWLPVLKEKYNVDSMKFNAILETHINREEPRKIAAIHSEENYKGELVRVQILFVSYIQVNGENGYLDSSSYIPVEIDFERKIMLIKAWNRQKVAHDENKVNQMMDHYRKLMASQFNISIRNYMSEHKKVLFSMSKKLIYEAYSHIPNYNRIASLNQCIQNFVDEIVHKIDLENVIVDSRGKEIIPDGVMEFDEEIKNVIEGLVISDHFYNKKFDEIWTMGLEAVVAKVKFNDNEQVLTSLSGENTSVPIFCTKTFINLKKRMEESERIETLWITMDRKHGNLNLKFDATNPEYLEVLIKYGIRFNQEDMDSALEIYKKYESKIITEAKVNNQVAIG